MKSTGIVRRLDDLGRITLPIELRRTLELGEKDPLEISVEDDKIILQKYDAKGGTDAKITSLAQTIDLDQNLSQEKQAEALNTLTKLREILGL